MSRSVSCRQALPPLERKGDIMKKLLGLLLLLSFAVYLGCGEAEKAKPKKTLEKKEVKIEKKTTEEKAAPTEEKKTSPEEKAEKKAAPTEEKAAPPSADKEKPADKEKEKKPE
jgi:type IV secretory pathway VirB10-like protein